MKPIVLYLASFFCSLVAFENAHSQEATNAIFKIVHLPRKTEYSKDKLNEEINMAKDKEAVRKVIRLKNFPSAQLIIQIQHAKNKFTWWTINTTSGYEREDDEIILQSRTSWNDGENKSAVRQPGDSLVWKIYKPSDFKDLFRDSLVLLDTLFVETHLQNLDYSNDGYKLAYVCSNGRIVGGKIPNQEELLIFSGDLFNDCDIPASFVSLSNKKDNGNVLVSAYLRFLTEEEKESLLAMAENFRKSDPGADIEKITLFVQAYASLAAGKPYYPQLLSWLRRNLN